MPLIFSAGVTREFQVAPFRVSGYKYPLLFLGSSSSWLSFGALPSKNISVKSHPAKPLKARRAFLKHAPPAATDHYTFEKIKKRVYLNPPLPGGWIAVSSSTEVCFYKKSPNWINDSIKLIITNSLSSIVMLFGIPVPLSSLKMLNLKEMDISEGLLKLESYKLCSGYEDVINKDNWLSVSLFRSHSVRDHCTR